VAKEDLEKIIGLFLGIVGGLVLAEILARLLGYKCPRCGAETKGQTYCPNCGHQVRK